MNTKPLTDKQRYWLKHIERCHADGQSLASYADAHDLDVKSLYRWKNTLSKLGCFKSMSATMFTRVSVEPSGRTDGDALQVRFPNGCVLQSSAIDEGRLRTLITTLLACS